MLTSYIPLRFDVTNEVPPFSEPLSIAGWLFAPPTIEQQTPRALLFCLPGGTYTKAYYHLEVPGYPVDSYSFALSMAKRGFLVIAVDHLGVGESTHVTHESLLTPEVVAHANNVVLQQVREKLNIGTLAAEVPPLPQLPIVGVGHSMGGMLAIVQQSHFRSFDALASLGWTNHALNMTGAEQAIANQIGIDADETTSIAKILDQVIESNEVTDEMLVATRAALHPFFHAPDVPLEVLQTDDAAATNSPVAIMAPTTDPNYMTGEASHITVPVFLAFGMLDVTPDPRTESATYPNSPDITLFMLDNSHHCHNFATTRETLWSRLAWWAEGVTGDKILRSSASVASLA